MTDKIDIKEFVPIASNNSQAFSHSNSSPLPIVRMSFDESTNILSVQASERSLNLYRLEGNGPNLTLVGKFEQPSKGIIIQGQLARDWREHAIIHDKGMGGEEKSVVITLSLE